MFAHNYARELLSFLHSHHQIPHELKSELADYVKSLSGDIKKIFVVHGEEKSSLAFADTLRHLKPSAKVTVPELNESFEV